MSKNKSHMFCLFGSYAFLKLYLFSHGVDEESGKFILPTSDRETPLSDVVGERLFRNQSIDSGFQRAHFRLTRFNFQF